MMLPLPSIPSVSPQTSATRGSLAPACSRDAHSLENFRPSCRPMRLSGNSRFNPIYCAPNVKSAETVSQEATADIEGLPLAHCNDFECTASPAVEQTIRSLARDVVRGGWTKSLFDRNVQYKDSFRSFQGQNYYQGHRFVASVVQQPRMEVQSVRLVGRTVSIKWRLQGMIGGTEVDVLFTDFFDMNLVTSVVEKHSEEWDLSDCSPLGSLIFTASRMAWSARQSFVSTGDKVNDALKSMSGSMDEGDEAQIYANPNDPTKFFQQDDTFKQDAIFFCLFLAVLYLVFQGWSSIFAL